MRSDPVCGQRAAADIAAAFLAYLDRVNVGFAALGMNADIGLSSAAYGFGAGIFFVTCVLVEVPSNLILARVGARRWLARIMFTWGTISPCMIFVRGEYSFHVLRALPGVAEAGLYPGIVFFLSIWFPAEYRARIDGLFWLSIPLSSVIGAPVSGRLLGLDGVFGPRGWMWLFIVEALPTLVLSFVLLRVVTASPAETGRLAPAERDGGSWAFLHKPAARLSAFPGAAPALHGLSSRRGMREHPPMADPVTVAVLRHRLSAIAEEMGEAMLRTAYSQILNSSRDFSIALIDPQWRLVAQADHIPVHVGALPPAVRALSAVFPDPAPGEVYLLNDPYRGGSHLPDLTIFVPVFAQARLVFWSVVRAHHSDIGGATHGAYNPAATEIWQEGLRIPPIRLTEGGVLREDLLDLLALNVRHPRDFRGDLAAQIGAARLGEQRLGAVFAELGAATVATAVEAILDAAERQSRAIVTTWPDGVYEGAAWLDDDGFDRRDIRIHARCTIAGSDLTIDLSGSDPQVRGFVNSSHANMISAATMAFAFLLDPDQPRNDGAFRPLHIEARPGTVVWAHEGAPVTMCTSHCANEIIEAIIVALAPACPERAMAGWGRRLRIALAGRDPRNGRAFIWHMFQARPGGGGSSAGVGWSTVGEWHSAGGIKFGSIEVAETRFPLVFETHEFLPGSEGAGRHRGGCGAGMRLRVEAGGPAIANTAGDGVRHGARGILGGQDGAPHDYRLLAPGAPPRPLASKEVGIVVPPGSVLEIRSGGGGGWGAAVADGAQA